MGAQVVCQQVGKLIVLQSPVWCHKQLLGRLRHKALQHQVGAQALDIAGYQFEYPIYLDLTDPKITNAGLSKTEYDELISTFCSYFEDQHYYIGIYSFEYFLNNNLDPSIFDKYDVWITSKGVEKPDFAYKYGIWQYSTGNVDGISGSVDLNYCYRNYPSVMTAYGLNGF